MKKNGWQELKTRFDFVASGYRFSKKARAGRSRIRNDVAEKTIAADQIYRRIFDKIEAVSAHLALGSRRPDLGENARMMVESN